MLIELHTHTNYSHGTKVFYDGINTPAEMVKQAEKLGINAIVITDHDGIRGAKEAQRYAKKNNLDIKVVIGEEVTSSDGHILGIGIQETVPPRLSTQETVDRIREQGGVAIAAHPFDIKRVGIGKNAIHCDAVEVFNAQNLDRLSNFKAAHFAKDNKMSMTAGSDAHSARMLGHGLNIAKKGYTDEDIIKYVRKGRIQIKSRYPSMEVVTDLALNRLKLSSDYIGKYIEDNYSWPKRPISKGMLRMVDLYPGKISPVFQAFSYFSLANVIIYSVLHHAFERR